MSTEDKHEDEERDEKKATAADEIPFSVQDLLQKCVRWFENGLSAALEIGEISDDDLAHIVRDENIRPLEVGAPRLLTTLRRFAAKVGDVAAIPLDMVLWHWIHLPTDGKFSKKYATVGVGPEILAPGEKKTVATKIQVPFRPTSLALDPSIAHYFVVHDVRVGKFSQFVGTSSIAGKFFGRYEGLPLLGDVAQPGLNITIYVENLDDKPQSFMGLLTGESLV